MHWVRFKVVGQKSQAGSMLLPSALKTSNAIVSVNDNIEEYGA